MIEIMQTGDMVFEQLYTRRRVLVVQKCHLYTDGVNRYVEIGLFNQFIESATTLQIEFNQFNSMNQLLRREVINQPHFDCPAKRLALMQPVAILPDCDHVKIRVISSEFNNLNLKDEVFYDGFETTRRFQKPHKNKKLKAIQVEHKMGPAIKGWFLVLIVTVITVTIAFFQYGLI
jgi:hypothetical protein